MRCGRLVVKVGGVAGWRELDGWVEESRRGGWRDDPCPNYCTTLKGAYDAPVDPPF